MNESLVLLLPYGLSLIFSSPFFVIQYKNNGNLFFPQYLSISKVGFHSSIFTFEKVLGLLDAFWIDSGHPFWYILAS